jgi:hypothetical protein
MLGEEAIRDGKIDFVGMTRRLLADPELPRKVRENRLEDIAPAWVVFIAWIYGFRISMLRAVSILKSTVKVKSLMSLPPRKRGCW